MVVVANMLQSVLQCPPMPKTILQAIAPLSTQHYSLNFCMLELNQLSLQNFSKLLTIFTYEGICSVQFPVTQTCLKLYRATRPCDCLRVLAW
jgi:hypothetical protein